MAIDYSVRSWNPGEEPREVDIWDWEWVHWGDAVKDPALHKRGNWLYGLSADLAAPIPSLYYGETVRAPLTRVCAHVVNLSNPSRSKHGWVPLGWNLSQMFVSVRCLGPNENRAEEERELIWGIHHSAEVECVNPRLLVPERLRPHSRWVGQFGCPSNAACRRHIWERREPTCRLCADWSNADKKARDDNSHHDPVPLWTPPEDEFPRLFD